MGLLDLASYNSAWRGYEYFIDKKIAEINKISETEFSGKAIGTQKQPYDVKIDISHPRKSSCNCPHANGKRIICKHQIALYFSVFPNEAEKYYNDVVRYAELEEAEQDELYDKVADFIYNMSKSDAQQALYELLFNGPEWQFDNFVQEHWID